MPGDIAKQKKTRRRLRVSCVECTRRRQKCDRTQPCGLCRRRGVEHLCRWELEPFARPQPSRPTGSRKTENKSSLERRAESQSSTETSVDDLVVDPAVSLRMLESEVKEAAIALAQLENISEPALLSVHFIDLTTTPKASFQLTSHPDCLSHRETTYHAMWDTIQTDRTSVERISFNWVTLLFATLALSSGCSSEEESRKYFLQALTSKRLAEDVQSASFFAPRHSGTYSQGTAHGCIAAALMADYLCDRGQMTEAWKLIGSAVRNAQNAGLYLNPAWNKWKDMTEDEQTLRTDGGKSFDGKISLWEASLPSYFALHDPDTSLDHAYPRLRLHRYLVAGHYYFCRMLFHRSLLCIKLLTGSSDEMVYKHHQWDFGNLSHYAIDLLHTQRSLITKMEPQRQICFMTSYFIFEAAVTLSIAMCRDPGHADVAEWRKERDEAIESLQSLLDMDNSELTQQAIVTLRILQDRKSRSTSVDDDKSDQCSVNELPSTDSGWILPESQNPILSSMFPIDTSHFQNPTVGLPDQLYTDTSGTSPFNLSGFDFLFNSVTPQ
ncbi:hypothetical protein A7U60_g4103 [Sanghuangporus baumii]|uniref:Zn(2)-C6 fungal-type domain-containing protein n=1 Tax=Sanghuangporus baumii TaxID=108892 RepID=A0A9Q5HZ67_SANBA|nr:hypothetical protein A7U60_g4103 [Sanghuangporus baumii]